MSGGNIYLDYPILIKECEFVNNTAGRGAAMYIDINSINFLSAIIIINSKIHNNLAYDSVVYVNTKNMEVDLISSGFTNNVGSCMYLLQSHLLCRSVVFANNSADNGGALYIGQGSTISYGETVQFINNSAVEHGGAVYLNLMYSCPIQTWNSILNISFVNNTADITYSMQSREKFQ